MEREKTVGFAVKNLSNEIKRAIDRSFHNNCHHDHEPDEMTGMQRWIVKYLYDKEKHGVEVFQKDLENRFNIRRSTVTGILQLMEKNGFVQRVPVDYDARLKKLVLTKKAFNIQKQVEREVMEMEAKFVKGISHEDLDTFFKVITQIRENCRED